MQAIVSSTASAAGGTPTLSSATFNTAGTELTIVTSESVSVGAGGNGGFTVVSATGTPTTIVTKAPTSDISNTGTWNKSEGSNFYGLVNDYPDTAESTYTDCSVAGSILFGYSAFSIPANSKNITVSVRYSEDVYSGTPVQGAALYVGGTQYNAGTHTVTGHYTRVDTWTQNPKTSAAWTVDDVNGAGANNLTGFGMHTTTARPFILGMQLEVTYSSPEALTYVSGSGSTSIVYAMPKQPALTGATYTVNYTQPGNGIEATSGGIDLASFTASAVTNNSTTANLYFGYCGNTNTACASGLTTPGGQTDTAASDTDLVIMNGTTTFTAGKTGYIVDLAQWTSSVNGGANCRANSEPSKNSEEQHR